MRSLRIDLDGDRRWFLPGDEISGRAVWRLDDEPDEVELRLFWHTGGKGTGDVEIVAQRRFEGAGASSERAFSFRLPLGPYSFSGSLITLAWSLELVVLPGEATERVDLIVAPTPVEVRLTGLGRPPAGHTFSIAKKRA